MATGSSKLLDEIAAKSYLQVPAPRTDVGPSAVDGERVFSAAFWHSKPDYVSLLTQKFNDLPEESEMFNDGVDAQKDAELLPTGNKNGPGL